MLGSQPGLRRCVVWVLALNVPFTLTGQIWHSYDFSTHVFLASHYQQNWWSLWEPRWFEGFDVASYPPLTQDQFFWAEHGILVAALVVALRLLRRRFRTFAPWYLLAVYLFVLGLGGTTPLPRLLFGPFWEWLTYDRFSIWADVPLLLLFGAAASAVIEEIPRRREKPSVLPETLERPAEFSPARRSLPGAAWLVTIGLLAIVACADALLPTLIQTEPVPIDPGPIVAFLAQSDHAASGAASWRYLTLGFGDQAGLLEAQTDAGTVDGYFYTARRLPLLTQSGIASLDYSLLWDPTAKTLRALLLQPEPHHLRWAFTDDLAYEKILSESGWRQDETLTNGIGVWEAIAVITPVEPAPPRGGFLAIWWGIAPLAALGAAVGLTARRLFG